MIGYDALGNIVIIKFDWNKSLKEKKEFALNYLEKNRNVKTVLEKTEKFHGRLRTLKTRFLAGDKNLEALYRENGCDFRFNVETCYFSPRLASERKEVAELVKKGENVLVMFGGVAPFAIIIAKLSKAKKVTSVELGKDCSKYAEMNVKRNKLQDKIQIVQGDVKRVLPKMKEKFDRIVMARPNLKDSFLSSAFPRIKKGRIIHYYGFYNEEDLRNLKDLITTEAKKAKKKIKIQKISRAGDIGARKFRYRADIKVIS